MSRMVASISQKKPHFVSCSADGRFECDSEKKAINLNDHLESMADLLP